MSIPITALSEPFPHDTVKQRKGNFGKSLDYVDATTVINRLNEALEGQWSFTIIEHKYDVDEMCVLGQMEIDGVIRQQFGGSQVTRNKDTGATVSLADDLKAATADCLKKCAASFGVALYLYNGTARTSTQQSQSGDNGNHQRSNGNGRITNQEITMIFATAKAADVPQSEVIKTAMKTYGKPISQLTQLQAQELIDQFQVTTGG